jgi:hypothetical protein
MRRLSPERRRAAGLAASSSALNGPWLMSWRHGHPVLGAVLLGAQFMMLGWAIVLMWRLRKETCM